MCGASDHERIGPMLQSFERASHLKHYEHAEAAKKAREAGKDDEADEHERKAAVHEKRAELADMGFLRHSKDEATDADHMRTHGDLFDLARRTGRVKFETD